VISARGGTDAKGSPQNKSEKNDNSYFGGCPNIANIILNNGANTD